MVFIALEGVDGSGKSTLVDAIIAELHDRGMADIEVYHHSQLKNDPFDEYALFYETYVPGTDSHIICDRMHWGETVYGPLYRESSALDTAGFRWVEMFLAARGATVWHVTAPFSVIETRLRLRGEDFLEGRHVSLVREEFFDAAERSMLCGGTADTYASSPEELAKKIVTDAMYKEENAAYGFNSSVIGSPVPSAILFGDTQGPGDPDVTHAPFMPRGTSSGKFLLEALPDSMWKTFAIANAKDVDIESVVNSRFAPNVVALGREAEAALSAVELDSVTGIVPHPQWVRRFHNSKKQLYGYAIRDVALFGGDKSTWPR